MRIEFGFAYFQLPYYLPPTIRFRPDSFVYCYNNNILTVCSIVAMRPVLFWHRSQDILDSQKAAIDQR